jgi:hypothetical protein
LLNVLLHFFSNSAVIKVKVNHAMKP